MLVKIYNIDHCVAQALIIEWKTLQIVLPEYENSYVQ